MELNRKVTPTSQLLLVAALLLATPVAMFWRPHLPFFFILDDWRSLIQMAEQPFWQYLTSPTMEHWYPFSNLIFYVLVKICGDRYDLLVLSNCLVTGLNAFLLYLFFRRHWTSLCCLALSLLYAGAGVHPATVWNSSYICFNLSLSFLLGALLLTDHYLRFPSGAGLLGVGLCALLSILANNFTLVGLMALPLYAVLVAESGFRREFWALAATLGLVYLLFALGYFTFAGAKAVTVHNRGIISHIPGAGYLVHWLFGMLSPFFYLFWGHYHFPGWAYFAGVTALILSLALIWWAGTSPEKRLGIWALLLNALPFLLVSLARYPRSLNQAFVPRYAAFTLIGALVLLGTAWHILSRKLPPHFWAQTLLPLVILAAMVYGQVGSLPYWREKYLEMGQAALNFYQELKVVEPGTLSPPGETVQSFLSWDCRNMTWKQALAVQRFLNGLPNP